MNLYHQFACYLCGEPEAEVRPGHARDDSRLVPLECSNCGLVSLSSFEHITDGFYENSHMHDDVPCDPELALLQNGEDNERRFNQFRDLLEGKHVFDIGCGSGGFLLEARGAAASVTGLEPEIRLQDHFGKNNLTVYPSFDHVPDSFFPDVITMFHVLEHIKDPLTLLLDVRKRFFSTKNPDRKLIIEVPSASDALLTIYKSNAFSKFTYWSCHLYLFTEDNVKEIAQRAGFDVVEMIQFQRYPLSNHMYWLAHGKQGGHIVWDFLNQEKLMTDYADVLKSKKACDTVIGIFS